MSKTGFVIRKIRTMDYKKMLQTASEVAQKNGTSKTGIFLDMIYCGFRYQAGYENYAAFNFHNVPDNLRSTYLTRGGNNAIINKFNHPEYRIYFDDKCRFMETFSEFTGREFLDLRTTGTEEFCGWINNRESFVAKVIDSDGGKGVSKFTTKLINNPSILYDELYRSRMYIVEDTVIQHKKMASLNPSSVNTVRVYTLYREDENKVYIPYAFIRVGREGFVDNYSSGGMTSKIDIQTGKIIFPCADKNGNSYERHPVTRTEFVGFRIPMWNEIKDLCIRAAKIIPQIGYVGWDVAVGEASPLLIEANAYPGNGIPQNPNFLPDKVGLKPLMEEITGMKL